MESESSRDDVVSLENTDDGVLLKKMRDPLSGEAAWRTFVGRYQKLVWGILEKQVLVPSYWRHELFSMTFIKATDLGPDSIPSGNGSGKSRSEVELWLCDILRNIVTDWVPLQDKTCTGALGASPQSDWAFAMGQAWSQLNRKEQCVLTLVVQFYDLTGGKPKIPREIATDLAIKLGVSYYELKCIFIVSVIKLWRNAKKVGPKSAKFDRPTKSAKPGTAKSAK